MIRFLVFFLFSLFLPGAVSAQQTSGGFSEGSVKIGYDNRPCNASLEGSIRYNSLTGGDITSNLVSHWKFDESSGSTASDSVGTNDGTLYNGAAGAPNMTWLPTGGQISGTLQFDTNDADNVRIPASESLKMNGDMTIAGWIKAVNDAADTQFIFSQRGPNQNKNYYLVMSPNGWLVFGHGNGTVYEAEAAVVQVADNTWHHIAFVADAPGKGYFYVDGAGVAVNPVTMDSDIQWTLSNDSMFGDVNSSFSYQGLLDDFRLYSRALSAADIAALYTYDGSGGAIQICDGSSWVNWGS